MFLIILIILTILTIIINYKLNNYASIQKDPIEAFKKLKSYMSSDLTPPILEKNGIVRVYVSASMFNIEDVIYAIGPDGLKPGLAYQAMDFPDMICNLSDGQWSELKSLCSIWDVPWYGITGEIEKMGWECYCPIRDGIPMAPVLSALNTITYEEIISSDPNSMFYPSNMKKILGKSASKSNMVTYAYSVISNALGLNIGANDLYNMYSTCNACIMNYNGIQADAGALAEIGQLGARGVPCVILKDNITGDFAGITNPMPTMATSSSSLTIPNLTTNSLSVYGNNKGALEYLQEKINRFIQSNTEDNNDPMSFGNYNNFMPLPPLQLFWTTLGSKAYLLKHRSKSIPTTSNGKTIFKKDYTDFWYKTMVTDANPQGYLNMAKQMSDNLNNLLKDPKWKYVHKYWD